MTPNPDSNKNLNEENSQHNLGDVRPAKNLSLDSYLDPHSDSDTSSSHAVSQESLNEIDPSNNHLVSGSSYSMHISEGRLLHQTWYDENQENNSSDEEVDDEFDDDLVAGDEDDSNDASE